MRLLSVFAGRDARPATERLEKFAALLYCSAAAISRIGNRVSRNNWQATSRFTDSNTSL